MDHFMVVCHLWHQGMHEIGCSISATRDFHSEDAYILKQGTNWNELEPPAAIKLNQKRTGISCNH